MAIMREKMAYTFDDVVIEPSYSEIRRGECDITPRRFQNITTSIPIISSPMSSVTEKEMMRKMLYLGGLGIHHRYCDYSKLLELYSFFDYLPMLVEALPIAVGSIPSHKETIDNLLSKGHKFFCVDVANGAHKNALDTVKYIREKCPDADIMSGSIATPEQADLCIQAGANILRIGVGSGSACTTRVVTGCGMPLLQSIMDIYCWLNREIRATNLGRIINRKCVISQPPEKQQNDRSIILVADGGIRNSGDIVKALAAGADYVILGGLLAGSEESPCEKIGVEDYSEMVNVSTRPGGVLMAPKVKTVYWKRYFGMASKKALVEGNNKDPNNLHIEGEEFLVPYTGPVKNTINKLTAGLRQGMFYVGAKDLQELKNKSVFRVVTNNGVIEGTAHGKQ